MKLDGTPMPPQPSSLQMISLSVSAGQPLCRDIAESSVDPTQSENDHVELAFGMNL